MPNQPELRASDGDRERVIAELREHAAVGRLTLEEFSERAERALHARTLDQLAALSADLPPWQRGRRGASRVRLRSAAAAYVATNGALLGGWVFTNSPGGLGAGPEPFWPLWPMVGAGAAFGTFLVARGVRRRETRAGALHARRA